MLTRTFAFLGAFSRPVLALVLVLLTGLIGFGDYFAGTDATFSAIYLFPIGVAAWFFGAPAAYVLAIISSLLWVGGDLAAGAQYSRPLVPIWNMAARFAVFALAISLFVELRKLHRQLEIRATERAIKLTSEIAARERLERELLQISEREQQRLGHDIHDSLCQHLTGTALASQVLVENLKLGGSAEADGAAKLTKLIEDAIILSRNLARGLNSVNLSTDGLMEALEDFAAITSDLFRISCRFECPLPVLIDDNDTAGHLYRITQEAVGNAVKHGHARNVVIRLESTMSAKILRVIDDGVGLPEHEVDSSGMGLRIMSYRAKLIGAKFNIRRRDAGGAVVKCVLPRQRELVQ